MVQGIGSVEAIGGAVNTSVNPAQYLQARQEALSAVAEKLGLSGADLRSQLQDGQSVTSIAARQGLSSQEVTNTVADSLRQVHPGASDRTMAALVERMISELQQHAANVQSAQTAVQVAGKPGAGVGKVDIIA